MGGKRLTKERIEEQIKQLTPKYKFVKTNNIDGILKVELKCDRGHEINMCWTDFRAGHRCKICSDAKAGEKRRLPHKYIREQIKKLTPTYECLHITRINSEPWLKLKCNKNHIYTVRWNRFQQGDRCPKCSRQRWGISRRHKLKYIKDEVNKTGEKLLSTTYINAYTKLEFQCSKGHKYQMTWINFSQGHRCKICGYIDMAIKQTIYSINIIKKQLNKLAPEYTLISTIYKHSNDKLEFRCGKGHKWEATWTRFLQGIRCQTCFYESQRIHDEDALQNIAWYRAIVTRYTNGSYCNYYYQINPNKLPRSSEEYHLDHIYTVNDGFNNRILPQIIAGPYNLQMIAAFDNQSKNGRSDITKEELFRRYTKFQENEALDIPYVATYENNSKKQTINL